MAPRTLYDKIWDDHLVDEQPDVDAARGEIEGVVRRVEKLETAVEPRFQEHFVAAMGIPHTTEPFPRLAATIDLPAPRTSSGGTDRPRRRRRDAPDRTS